MAKTKTKPVRFTYPLPYKRGIVNERFPIIRIRPAKNAGESFVYFRVNDIIYVGYSMRVGNTFSIMHAKPAKDQTILSYEAERGVIVKPSRAKEKKKIKIKHMTQDRTPAVDSYEDEVYATKTVEVKGKLHIVPELVGKSRAKSLAREPKQLAENKEVEQALELGIPSESEIVEMLGCVVDEHFKVVLGKVILQQRANRKQAKQIIKDGMDKWRKKYKENKHLYEG